MSVIVFAGAAQFAAVGYVASGLAWPGIILLTALLNARHLLYSAALAPWLRGSPVGRRAAMAHLLTDEAFALAISHFRRIGRADERGYWFGAFVVTFIPWNLATLAGRRPRRPDPGPGAVRHRRHLPGRHDRAGGRPDHRPARAGRGHRRRRASRSSSRLATSPAIGDRGRRRPRAAGRAARAGGDRGGDRAARHAWRPRTATRCPTRTSRDPSDRRSTPPDAPSADPTGHAAMSTNLVLLAVLMFAVTYPSRAVGLLTPGLDRLPKVAFDYLQLVGPAVLAALAAVSVMVVVGDDDVPSFHVGIEWVAVFVCLAIVARRRNLLLGLVAAIAIVAIARAAGLAAMPG